ncbi:MAG: glutaminyl-peptide cyclotransferase [Schleiferiaceae bacterium]|nr:glutaminyl-peptide cyclotransferase [Schleiferiaceae bacterium]
MKTFIRVPISAYIWLLFISFSSCDNDASKRIRASFLPKNLPTLMYEPQNSLPAILDKFDVHDSCTVVLTDAYNDTITNPSINLYDCTPPLYLYFTDAHQSKKVTLLPYAKQSPMEKSVRVVDSMAIDKACFTQGLVLLNGQLYISCGQYGEAQIYAVAIETKKVTKRQLFDHNIFLEGIDVYENQLICLTWRENKIVVLDENLVKTDSLPLPSLIQEGWGIFTKGDDIYISNGSDKVYQCKKKGERLEIVRVIYVHENGRAINRINEMGLVNDTTFAFNRWYDNTIYFASIRTGEVVGHLNLEGLAEKNRESGVLNGIHIQQDTAWITGKNWPFLYTAVFE